MRRVQPSTGSGDGWRAHLDDGAISREAIGLGDIKPCLFELEQQGLELILRHHRNPLKSPSVGGCCAAQIRLTAMDFGDKLGHAEALAEAVCGFMGNKLLGLDQEFGR